MIVKADDFGWLYLLLAGIALLGLLVAVLEILRRRRRPLTPAREPAHARARAHAHR